MAESKHTPGPWRVSNGVNVMAGDSRYVAATAGLEDRLRFGLSIETINALNEEDAANARMSAAAPEMYEALKAALKVHGSGYSWGESALAALAKAEA